MSAATNNRILNVYKSRTVILELLDNLGYNTDDYDGFTINEVDAMYASSQLDMLLTNAENKKIYVRYYISDKTSNRQLRPANIDEIVRDLYLVESVLTRGDTLMIVMDDDPNDSVLAKLEYIYNRDGVFVVAQSLRRLQFNVLNHAMVPKVEVLTREQTDEFRKTYNVNELSQLPQISRFDPMALAVCMRPGQVCKIVRQSPTALSYDYYRVCL
jgi:DNA-directed RNA polymerase subunit H (RpoH/RPB5)